MAKIHRIGMDTELERGEELFNEFMQPLDVIMEITNRSELKYEKLEHLDICQIFAQLRSQGLILTGVTKKQFTEDKIQFNLNFIASNRYISQPSSLIEDIFCGQIVSIKYSKPFRAHLKDKMWMSMSLDVLHLLDKLYAEDNHD
nr:putative ORF1 [Marmot picobirnavirus]